MGFASPPRRSPACLPHRPEAGGAFPEMPLPPGPNRRQPVSNHSRHRPSLQLLTLCPSDLPSRGDFAREQRKAASASPLTRDEAGAFIRVVKDLLLPTWTREEASLFSKRARFAPGVATSPEARLGHWLAA